MSACRDAASSRDHADPGPASSSGSTAATTTRAVASRRTGSARRWSPSGCPTSARCRTTSPSTPTAASTRGIHTEPWDKFVSLATGRIFGAWVDMREGETFGTTFTSRWTPRSPSSCRAASATATRRSRTRRPTPTSSTTTGVPASPTPRSHLGDPTAAIAWPIPLTEAIISEKDQNNPALDPCTAMAPKKTLIVGALGQLGRALHAAFPGADRVDLFAGEGVTALDLTDAEAVAAWPWHEYAVVLNAAAYTAVDAAETAEGRVAAWAANATAPAHPRPAWPASTASRWCTTPRSTSSTAPRRSSPGTPRTSRSPRSASTPSPRPPATSPSASPRATTSCARRG